MKASIMRYRYEEAQEHILTNLGHMSNQLNADMNEIDANLAKIKERRKKINSGFDSFEDMKRSKR